MMRKTNIAFSIRCLPAVALILLMGVSQSSAAISLVGDPFEGSSWGQQFNESGVGLFDLIAAQVSSGGPFEKPVFRNFSDAAWTDQLIGGSFPSLAIASGPATTNLNFNMEFFGNSSTNTIQFDFVAFSGTSRLESAHAIWNGSNWSITNGSWVPTRSQLDSAVVPLAAADVPEPSSMIAWSLLGLTIGGAGWRRRRKATA